MHVSYIGELLNQIALHSLVFTHYNRGWVQSRRALRLGFSEFNTTRPKCFIISLFPTRARRTDETKCFRGFEEMRDLVGNATHSQNTFFRILTGQFPYIMNNATPFPEEQIGKECVVFPAKTNCERPKQQELVLHNNLM